MSSRSYDAEVRWGTTPYKNQPSQGDMGWRPPADYVPPKLPYVPVDRGFGGRDLDSNFAGLRSVDSDPYANGWPPPPGPSGPSGPSGPTYDSAAKTGAYARAIGAIKPQPYTYQDFSYTPSPRDTSMYDTVRAEIARRKGAALAGVDKRTEYLTKVLAGFTNPFAGGLRTATPQMAPTTSTLLDPRSQGLVNQNIVDPLNNQSQIFDSGMADTLRMLAGGWDQSMQSRGLENDLNDYYYRDQADQAASSMGFGVDMADAADARAYQKYVDEINYQIGTANNAGQNTAAQGNVQGANEAQMAAINAILGLIGSTSDGNLGQLTGLLP